MLDSKNSAHLLNVMSAVGSAPSTLKSVIISHLGFVSRIFTEETLLISSLQYMHYQINTILASVLRHKKTPTLGVYTMQAIFYLTDPTLLSKVDRTIFILEILAKEKPLIAAMWVPCILINAHF